MSKDREGVGEVRGMETQAVRHTLWWETGWQALHQPVLWSHSPCVFKIEESIQRKAYGPQGTWQSKKMGDVVEEGAVRRRRGGITTRHNSLANPVR